MNHTRPKRLLRFSLGVLVMVLLLIAAIAALDTTSVAADVNLAAPQAQANRLIGFEFQNYVVSEAAGKATIGVVINQSPVTTSTIEYLTVDGTAKAGVDYIATSGTLSFTASGDTAQSFDVTIINDEIDEPNKTVNLILRNPVNATLNPLANLAVLTIQDDEPTPTSTPGTAATPTPVFADDYEPNNTLQNAYTTSPDAAALKAATLWPAGDVDYYRFAGKKGAAYEILTSNLTAGIDTVLTLYNPSGNVIASNDDGTAGSRASKITFTAGADGFFTALVTNKSPTDPANQTYDFEVNQVAGTPTVTPLPSATRVPGADACEYNGDFDSACLIGAGETLNVNFVPLFGEGPDNDFYRLWVKAGLGYTCQTLNLSSVNDTNMIIYDQNKNGLAGNDDRAPGDLASEVTYRATYTGWLYILVGPVSPVSYADSFLYTYSIQCTEAVAPTATATSPPISSGGGSPRPPTPTSFTAPSLSPTPALTSTLTAVAPTPTLNVQVNPLPTSTSAGPTAQTLSINLTVYFDANLNFTPELTEGIEDVAVAIFVNSTNEMIAFGYTNEAGAIRFGPLETPGTIRISVPYFNYTQVVSGDSNIVIRIAPPVTSDGSS